MSWEITQESIDRTLAYFNNVVSRETVSLTMDRVDRGAVAPLGETKEGSRAFIEPVRDVAHAVFLLSIKVELVRSGDVGGVQAVDIVAVEEECHLAMVAREENHFRRSRPYVTSRRDKPIPQSCHWTSEPTKVPDSVEPRLDYHLTPGAGQSSSVADRHDWLPEP